MTTSLRERGELGQRRQQGLERVKALLEAAEKLMDEGAIADRLIAVGESIGQTL